MRILKLITLTILSLTSAAFAAAQSSTQVGNATGANGEMGLNSSHHGRRVYVGFAEPRTIYSPDPEYTSDAKEKRIEGAVILSATVDENGVPRDIKVVKALDPGLDQNAIKAVQMWRFKPFVKDGVPKAVQVNIEMNFRLPKGPSSPS